MRKVNVTGDEPEHIPAPEEPEHIPEPGSFELEHPETEVFPPEAMEAFRGLLYVGAIEREVEYAGHKFLLKTLNEGEVLRVGQLVSEWNGTLGQAEAQRVYLVAASLQRLDGRELTQPLGENYDVIYDKAQILKTWYPVVVRHLFGVYQDLERTAVEVANRLGER